VFVGEADHRPGRQVVPDAVRGNATRVAANGTGADLDFIGDTGSANGHRASFMRVVDLRVADRHVAGVGDFVGVDDDIVEIGKAVAVDVAGRCDTEGPGLGDLQQRIGRNFRFGAGGRDRRQDTGDRCAASPVAAGMPAAL
jgi:hypothetical protein